MSDLQPGRDLDAAVAKVLGWSVVVPDGQEDWYDRQVTSWPCLIMREGGGYFLDREENLDDWEIWRPSTDTAAAVDALEEWKRQLSGQRTYQIIAHDTGEYTVSVSELKGWGADWWELKHADGNTFPHAAALALVATTQKESV